MAARQYTRRLLTGMLTYLPLVARLSERTTGGSDSAAYCYRIWLRHLVLADRAGLPTHPKVAAEIGPGDSLGTGIMALLTGATARGERGRALFPEPDPERGASRGGSVTDAHARRPGGGGAARP